MNFQALIFSFIAGMSTLVGSIILIFRQINKKYINLFLILSSGVMIGISLFDLIPTSFSLLSNYTSFLKIFIITILVIIGIIISNLISDFVSKHNSNNNLYKLGVISTVIIVLHNIPEGIITYVGTSYNSKLGLSLVLAIALHNIPEGISISLPIYYSSNNKIKAIIYTLIAGLSEPFGALIAYLLFDFINSTILSFSCSIVAGIMINIALNDLLKEALNN